MSQTSSPTSRACEHCGVAFAPRNSAQRFCSAACYQIDLPQRRHEHYAQHKAEAVERARRWAQQHPEQVRAYRQKPEARARKKALSNSPAARAQRREYSQRPEVRERRRAQEQERSQRRRQETLTRQVERQVERQQPEAIEARRQRKRDVDRASERLRLQRPEVRARKNELARQYYQRHRAAIIDYQHRYHREHPEKWRERYAIKVYGLKDNPEVNAAAVAYYEARRAIYPTVGRRRSKY